MSKPTANWEKLCDKFYRKIQLYTGVFDGDLELDKYCVAGAPYSGAIAIYRDDNKIHAYHATQAARGAKSNSIDIYSCAGKLIRRIPWDKGTIKGLGWSEDEKLLIVTDDGTVRCYYDLQGDFVPFTLGHGAEDHGVVSCRFYSTGFVALLSNNHLISVPSYTEPRPKLLALPPPDQPIVSWALIPPAYSLSRSVEVILAIGKTLYVVDATDAEDRDFTAGPFRHIAVSPRAEFLAFYTDDGTVWVVSGDWSEKLSEYTSRAKTVPRDMQWCGSNAVALGWEDEVHLVGPNSACAKFYYTSFVHLLPDIDGLRLLTNDVCDFLQKVPDETVSIFRLGSDSPAANLLEATSLLDDKSPKADDLIQIIRPNLTQAVETCVKAASHEYNIHWQKSLLKAASYGKSVLDLYNADEFVDMCETLRVLNAVRFYEVGLPLSYDQFKRLTPESLIDRLTNRHEYLLALRISEYLNLPAQHVLEHWAKEKVRHATGDEHSTAQLIVKKLHRAGARGVSFETIARAAYDEGRVGLATELLNFEPRAGKQVPLLLSMGEEQIALDKAIESGDPDLVMHVLLHLRRKLPLASFFRVINSRPTATALVEASAWAGGDEDAGLLKDLFYQDDRRMDGSNLLVSEALSVDDLKAAEGKLMSASKYLAGNDKLFASQRSHIDDAIRLLRLQQAFDKDLGLENEATAGVTGRNPNSYVGLSAHETAFCLIKAGHFKRASKIISEFKIPDKTAAWLKLRALVAARHWNELEELSKQKKSVIGWEPYFRECLEAGNSRVASCFIPKSGGGGKEGARTRVEMYVKVGMLVKAAEEAVRVKDKELWEGVRERAGGSAAIEIEALGAGAGWKR